MERGVLYFERGIVCCKEGICAVERSNTTSPPRMFLSLNLLQNIGFNIVPSDPFMSHLSTKLGYSAGGFQALQLIALATFGVMD